MPGLKKLDPLNVKIGSRLKGLRDMHGLTQTDLAKRMKLTRTALVNIEAGRQNFMVYHFVAYSKALHIPVEKLFAFAIK